jgi:hypothetical protein
MPSAATTTETSISTAALGQSLIELLTEVGEGPPKPKGTWVVSNEAGAGLMGTLDKIDAATASRVPTGCKHSIAAHAGHLLFAFDLFNRAMRGEDGYASAKWDDSWRTQSVDDAAWSSLRARLREQIGSMLEGIRTHHPDLAKEGPVDNALDSKKNFLTGAIANVAHAAYHLGAIRQLAAMSG